jgi:dipeptidyl aminopeptidase/acylaminoacyl peptidase
MEARRENRTGRSAAAGQHSLRRLALAAAGLLCLATAFAADETPSVASLFAGPKNAGMVLSPDGLHIASLTPVNGRMNVVVMDVATRRTEPVTEMRSRDAVNVWWINNHRLLFESGTLGTTQKEIRGGGLYAIDIDGNNGRQMGTGRGEAFERSKLGLARPLVIVRMLPGDGNDFIAQEYLVDKHGSTPGALVRVDTRNADRHYISDDKPESGDAESWTVDRNGVGRTLTVSSEGRVRIWYRAAEHARWEKLDEYSMLSPDKWAPVAVATDGKSLLVTSWAGRDKAAIRRYDPATRTMGEVIAEHPQVDLGDVIFGSDGEALGVRYEADRTGFIWFDAARASIQSEIDKALPDTVNSLSGSRDMKRFLVTSFSDVQPGTYYLFDAEARKLEWLAESCPWIDPKKLSHVQPIRYKARDGLEIPGYLALPRGSSGRNLPMVVMVHGGPWVEGARWYYNPEVQFLTSRGYAVLQPNYRGTTRYGWKHFSSSFKQWGLAMQDDITDGVRWAIAEGVADPSRICIYGASYGGYAALMGLATTPDLYRCAIDYVGITDLRLFVAGTSSDMAYSPFLRFELNAMIGDPDKDAERLKSTSPLELASRIKAPVFLAYASADRRVIPAHGLRMKEALEAAGRKPTWMMAQGEGHGYRTMDNDVKFYGAMEEFLAANLGTDKQ